MTSSSPATNWSAETHVLDRLFRARSVALVGVSSDPAKLTGAPLRNLLKTGYQGAIYPVNPRYERIGDLRCFGSIEDLPEAPDAALIMLGAKQVPQAIEDCGRKGTQAAIVLSSGFEETTEGAALARQLATAAAANRVAVIGPNCEGIWSVRNRMVLTFGSAANREQLHHAPLAVVSQSGAIAGAISRHVQDSGFGCSYVASVGNETCLDAVDVIEWLLQQDDVKVIALFLEGLKRGHRLVEVANQARRRGIQIVALKSGNTALGRIAAGSHTGKIASAEAIYRDVFRQCGIIQVEGINELLEASEILTSLRRPRRASGASPGVAVFSIPGGTRALTVDLCEKHNVPLATFDTATEKGLADLLPSFSRAANPTDLTGQVLSDPDLFRNTLAMVATDPNCEALLVQFANRGPADFRENFDRMAAVAEDLEMPVVASFLGDLLPAHERRAAMEKGVLPVREPADAVRQLGWLYETARNAEASRPTRPRKVMPGLPGGLGSLSWPTLVNLLEAAGIEVPRTALLTGRVEPLALAGLAFPLVVKVLPEHADHKTELGLVEVGLHSFEVVEEAANRLRKALGNPDAPLLIQEMVRGVEVVLSAIADPDFGPMLAVGTGGTGVELWGDLAYLPLPTDEAAVTSCLERLKLGRLLKGFRGRPPADVEALVRASVRLGDLMLSLDGKVMQIEINPLFVLPAGSGVVAADILVRDRQPD
ncbi:acetate--CoA ligase family protein [Propylenella binzhouense]|uniref:CoA-binding protein n=1 Tax=Propylenella binzhouense TaxID=2555902 RepID=A0A964T1U1_9HYPH|nr:acetate--CoA ligase family protein [Propylenella binzhouense]MYZ46427.1 CoA-binding protein [Propylenella binzhouense]